MDDPQLQQMIDFVQGEVRLKFKEAQERADGRMAEMIERFDKLDERLMRMEQRMSDFERRQLQFEAALRDVGRGLRELRERV